MCIAGKFISSLSIVPGYLVEMPRMGTRSGMPTRRIPRLIVPTPPGETVPLRPAGVRLRPRSPQPCKAPRLSPRPQRRWRQWLSSPAPSYPRRPARLLPCRRPARMFRKPPCRCPSSLGISCSFSFRSGLDDGPDLVEPAVAALAVERHVAVIVDDRHLAHMADGYLREVRDPEAVEVVLKHLRQPEA